VFNEHRDLSKVRGIVEETTGDARHEEVVSNGRRQVGVFFSLKKKKCVLIRLRSRKIKITMRREF